MKSHVIPDLDQTLSILARPVRLLLDWLDSLRRAVEDRRVVLRLAEADDHFLKDIGLLRSDVDGALAEPFYRRSSVLLTRSAERRARAEASIRVESAPQLRRTENCAPT